MPALSPDVSAVVGALRAGVPGFDGSRDQVAVRVLRDGAVGAVVRRDGSEPAAWRVAMSGERTSGENPLGRAALRVEPIDPSNDERLPGAVLLRDHRKLEKRLERRVRVAGVRLVGYRPENRATARVECDGGRVLYLKLLTKRAYAEAAGAYARVGRGGGNLTIVHPIATLDKECALLLPAADGESLRGLLASGTPPGVGTLVDALGALARQPFDSPVSTPERTLDTERAAAVRLLERGERWVPGLGVLRRRIEALTLPRGTAPVTLHADLHDKQIFVADGRVSLIDCEGMCRGDSRLDRVNLGEHLRLRSRVSPRLAASERFVAELMNSLMGPEPEHERRAVHALVRARLAGVQAQRLSADPCVHSMADQLAEEALALCEPPL